MDFLYDFVKTYWYYFVIGLLSLLLAGVTTYLFLKNEDVSINECEEKVVYVEEAATDKIFVDVKGAVNSPGVYEMDSISIINDQTTTNMIQRISHLFATNPLISKEI